MKDIIIDSLKYCQEHKGLVIYAWCLMPSHLHLICSTESGQPVSDIMRDFKKFTSRALMNEIENGTESRREWLLRLFSEACGHLKREQNYKVWQNGYHAEELRSNKFIYQKLEYVHDNPVKDGVVSRAEDYLYCSAPAYAGEQGLIDVEFIRQRMRTIS